MLTQARADALTEILNADEARAQTLLNLEPDEALRQINAMGNDFTLDELNEYGEALEAGRKGELNAEALDNVAGGVSVNALFKGVTIGFGGYIASRWFRK
jgi:hypothetical protein